jgi:hypothetical protein
MSDITKCTDSKCPSREHCYRWLAKPDPHGRQSYADFNRDEGEEKCEDGYLPT